MPQKHRVTIYLDAEASVALVRRVRLENRTVSATAALILGHALRELEPGCFAPGAAVDEQAGVVSRVTAQERFVDAFEQAEGLAPKDIEVEAERVPDDPVLVTDPEFSQ